MASFDFRYKSLLLCVIISFISTCFVLDCRFALPVKTPNLDLIDAIFVSAPILDVQPRSIGPLLTSTAASSGVSAPSAVSASKPSFISHLSSRSSGATSAANASSSSSLNSDEDRKKVSLKMLITLLTFNRANFEKSLVELLSLQDGKGMTPLMLAINLKCYNMAVQIFNAAKRLATDSKGHINDVSMHNLFKKP